MGSKHARALARLVLFTLLAACGGISGPGLPLAGVPFSAISAGLQGAHNPALAWGDEDGDGLPDLVLAGNIQATGRMTRIHQNLGSGAFSAALPGITDVDLPAVAWGDYDNDGLLDLVVAGVPASGIATTTLYHNLGGNVFVPVTSGLPGVQSGALAWADCDSDGRLDIAIAGLDVAGQDLTAIYRNAPGGGKIFANVNAGLVPLGSHPCLAWGDYDNDGSLDLAQTGDDATGSAITRVWRNDPASFGGFSATQGWIGVDDGSLAWGDYDSDGLLDLATGGQRTPASFGAALTVHRNLGAVASPFLALPGALPDFGPVALGWADADADGHLDLGVNGLVGTTELAIVYQNQNLSGATPNAPPTAPTNVSATTVGSVTKVTWTPATDAVTPSAGLSYNLRVGLTATGSSLYPSMADGTGRRLIPAMGLVRYNPNSPALLMLPGGSQTFWVSVQAVDGGLVGGPWSIPVSFVGPT